MRTGIIATKLGMSRVFAEDGNHVPVTVLHVDNCQVVAVRTPDADGYEAVQLAWEPVADRKVSKPERGHLAKAQPRRHDGALAGGGYALGALPLVFAAPWQHQRQSRCVGPRRQRSDRRRER